MKNALITTTINIPHNLEAYAKDIAEFCRKDIAIIIAGDTKTPKEISKFCFDLQEKTGVLTFYLSPGEQDRLYPGYSKWLPWNCIQRRNLAILHAYHSGAEVIATIDDDNFWRGKDYFGEHLTTNTAQSIATKSGWFNVCSRLDCEEPKTFFHRGYSFKNRKCNPEEEIVWHNIKNRIVVNAGMWLGDPDIDAVTRLAIAPIVHGYDFPGKIILEPYTKSPFNSQNTALHRDVIPAYCMLPFTGRYDDIIPSYFVKRIADHLGDYVSFGTPIVRQVRNNHDIWKDLEDEKLGMQLIDHIVDWLYEIPLTGKDYRECIRELIPAFSVKTRDARLSEEQDVFLHNIVAGYKEWMKYT